MRLGGAGGSGGGWGEGVDQSQPASPPARGRAGLPYNARNLPEREWLGHSDSNLMETPRRELLSRLYHAVLECPPAERSAFLKDACAGDPALQRELESLLRHEPAAARFLEIPAAQIVANAHTPDPAMVGRQLGPYKIAALLGAGGMGEVYRARDTKLGRDVAIKILPVDFTADPERRSRFAREARLLATLNHPHIGAIYGLEESDGVAALVLEFVDGPTLADRLKRGPLPIAESVAVARQIAEALEAAHERGIVHRDLKPANVILQGAGHGPPDDVHAKVLDFGLAKPVAMDLAADLTQESSLGRTEDGRILGTPAYMSPEQARGLAVDKRTDIWSFGCVLFEMLTGRRPFEGATITDALAQILDREPDWTLLPDQTPAIVVRLLHRCLRKDRRRRLHDIADAILDLEETVESAPKDTASAAGQSSRRIRTALPWLVAAVLGTGLLSVSLLYFRRDDATPSEVVEFSIAPPEQSRFAGGFAISPDGRHVAFPTVHDGIATLWVRTLATNELRRIPGTETARSPFWSPDSESLGFFADRQLKTVRLKGGSPVVLCAAFDPSGYPPSGTWSGDDVIVFAVGAGPLQEVGAARANGTPKPVTQLSQNETAHLWPQFLPDNRHFIYFAQGGGTEEVRVGAQSSPDTVSLGRFESHAAYANGSLFFAVAVILSSSPLMRRPFA